MAVPWSNAVAPTELSVGPYSLISLTPGSSSWWRRTRSGVVASCGDRDGAQ